MNLELTTRYFSVYCYSFLPNCRGMGGSGAGQIENFWGKKPSSSFNYYERMT